MTYMNSACSQYSGHLTECHQHYRQYNDGTRAACEYNTATGACTEGSARVACPPAPPSLPHPPSPPEVITVHPAVASTNVVPVDTFTSTSGRTYTPMQFLVSNGYPTTPGTLVETLMDAQPRPSYCSTDCSKTECADACDAALLAGVPCHAFTFTPAAAGSGTPASPTQCQYHDSDAAGYGPSPADGSEYYTGADTPPPVPSYVDIRVTITDPENLAAGDAGRRVQLWCHAALDVDDLPNAQRQQRGHVVAVDLLQRADPGGSGHAVRSRASPTTSTTRSSAASSSTAPTTTRTTSPSTRRCLACTASGCTASGAPRRVRWAGRRLLRAGGSTGRLL